jgi:hypothetical protein
MVDVSLKQFLQALRDVGEEAEADEIEQKMLEKFKDTSITKTQLLDMNFHVVTGTLNMAKLIRQIQNQPQQSRNTLKSYVNNLQVQGYSVAVNPDYQYLLESKE